MRPHLRARPTSASPRPGPPRSEAMRARPPTPSTSRAPARLVAALSAAAPSSRAASPPAPPLSRPARHSHSHGGAMAPREGAGWLPTCITTSLLGLMLAAIPVSCCLRLDPCILTDVLLVWRTIHIACLLRLNSYMHTCMHGSQRPGPLQPGMCKAGAGAVPAIMCVSARQAALSAVRWERTKAAHRLCGTSSASARSYMSCGGGPCQGTAGNVWVGMRV